MEDRFPDVNEEVVDNLGDYDDDDDDDEMTESTTYSWGRTDYNESGVVKVRDGADVTFQCGKFGNALHVATFLGNESIVQMLLENGADANSHGNEHGSAL